MQNRNFIIDPNDNQQGAELDLLRFSALQLGHLQESADTFNLNVKAIAYARQIQTGVNPRADMNIAKLTPQWAIRQDGAPRRKLPISVADLLTVKRIDDTHNVDELILFCVIFLDGTLC